MVDLNAHYVLSLNDDASVHVLNPPTGLGKAELVTTLRLSAPAFDWAMSPDATRVWLSIPERHEIAEIDARTWRLRQHQLEGLKRPTLMTVDPHRPLLWVAFDDGLAALDSDTLRLRALVRLVKKPIGFTLSTDGSRGYALLPEAVTMIDTARFESVHRVPLEGHAIAMDYATIAEDLYVIGSDGSIVVIDGLGGDVVKRIAVSPGLQAIAIPPSGRFGFAVNPVTDEILVLDAARRKVVQSGHSAAAPSAVAFSSQTAYISHRNSPAILMVGLNDPSLGRKGGPLLMSSAVGGKRLSGLHPETSPAQTIVPVPGGNAVLIANYPDRTIYLHKAGMAALVAQLKNFGRSPRAVLAIDQGLRGRAVAGTYSTTAVIPAPGRYQAIFFVDAPRLSYCFPFEI